MWTFCKFYFQHFVFLALNDKMNLFNFGNPDIYLQSSNLPHFLVKEVKLMKKIIMSKTAALIASLMIISMLVPVLAFAAASFQNVMVNSNGTVTGEVYVTDDVYTSGMNVPVYVYANDGMTSVASVVYGTYIGNGRYSFTTSVPTVTYNTYHYLQYGTVTKKVYAISFKDLAGHWSKKEVEALASNLVVKGTGDNMFSPNRNITRAEFAALIVRALGLDATGTTSSFTDVAAGKWYTAAVATAAKAGIITGYVDGTFKPNANVSRSEISAMISRALKYAGKDVTLSATQVSAALAKFSDAGTLGWAKSDVAVAVSEGLINGQSANKLAGSSLASRAEASTIVYRFLGNVGFIN
jgi:hypothetical protein